MEALGEVGVGGVGQPLPVPKGTRAEGRTLGKGQGRVASFGMNEIAQVPKIQCRSLIGQPFVPEKICPVTSFLYAVVIYPVSVIYIR